MKKSNDLQNFSNRPSPDNNGLLLENPKNVSEAAAELNRDVAMLVKKFPKRNEMKNEDEND